MKTSDFYYDLPQELIAQTPVEPRNSSRLMILHKDSGELEHRIFKDLPEYLRPGDSLHLGSYRDFCFINLYSNLALSCNLV